MSTRQDRYRLTSLEVCMPGLYTPLLKRIFTDFLLALKLNALIIQQNLECA